ncbi:hypothetical protein NB723_001478 [Xanthomonas sacchari]|nr:hypothetical protein [Xanthomonas sacchari]
MVRARSACGVSTARGSARTLIRPFGAPSPKKGAMVPEGEEKAGLGWMALSPSPSGRGVGVRVRARSACGVPTARGSARTLIRPFGAPSPKKGAMVPEGEGKAGLGWMALSPFPSGRGVGVRVRARSARGVSTARGSARTLIRPFGAPSPKKGAMVPTGEGEAGLDWMARSPSPPGRGVGVRVRARSACGVSTARGSVRTLIRPFGAPSPKKGAMVPEGEGKAGSGWMAWPLLTVLVEAAPTLQHRHRHGLHCGRDFSPDAVQDRMHSGLRPPSLHDS